MRGGEGRKTPQLRWPLHLELLVEVLLMEKLEMTFKAEELATVNAQKCKERRYSLGINKRVYYWSYLWFNNEMREIM